METYHVHGLEDLLILPKLIYRVNVILIKIPARSFVDKDKLILKCICKGKGTRLAKIILTKKNKVGGITLPGIKAYYTATVIKTMWYWWGNRHRDQWNRIENPEMDHNTKYQYSGYRKLLQGIPWWSSV